MSLQQCIDYAWGNHPQIKLLEKGNAISSEQLEQLKAAVQPNLYFNASQNLNMGRSIDPFTYQFTNENIFSNNFSINSSINLFSGFKYKYSREQQQLQIEANNENIQKIKNDIALSIANQYLQVLLLKEQITAIDSQLTLTQAQVKREETLLSSGKSNQNKLLQLKAQRLNEENRKLDLNNSLKIALVNLKYACAIKNENFDVTVPEIDQQINQLSDYSLKDVMTEAEKNMASIKYQRANEAYYKKGIDVSKSGYYPTLTLNGSLSTGYSSARKQTSIVSSLTYQPIGYLYTTPSELVYGPVLQNSFVQSDYSFGNQIKDNFSQFLGLNLRVPILTNRGNKTSVAVAKINVERAELETQNALLSLNKDVETAINNYIASREKLNRNKEIENTQNEILTNLNKFYVNGNVSLFELLSQKNNVYQSKSSLLLSKYDCVFRKLVIDYYSGKPIQL